MLRSRLAWLYLLTVALVWGLGEFVGERTVPTLLLAYAPPVLWLLPAPLVLGWTLIRRRGVPVALTGLLLAAWGAGVLHGRPQTGGTLRVLTFNVARGTQGTPERVAAAIRAADADLVLLQETNFIPAGHLEAVRTALPDYALTAGHEVMTLSRLPVLGSGQHPIPGSRRTVLETTVRWRGEPLRVVNTHLNTVLVSSAFRGDWNAVRRTHQARAGQVELLCEITAQDGGPVLVGGDLNTPPRGQLFRQLRACIGPDAHAAAGRGPGWTFPGLGLRIDHLLTRGLTPTRATVLPPSGSDHRPLLAEFRESFFTLSPSGPVKDGAKVNICQARLC